MVLKTSGLTWCFTLKLINRIAVNQFFKNGFPSHLHNILKYALKKLKNRVSVLKTFEGFIA